MIKLKSLIILLTLFLVIIANLSAGEFRRIQPIPTPLTTSIKGAKPTAKIKEIDPQKAESYTRKILQSWNSEKFKKYISSDFYEKSRLFDSMTDPTKVPKDARINVLSIDSVQTLNQYERNSSNGKEIISIISVTATTQIEFNDPQRGFRRLEGTNEYIIKVTEQE
jgi:hypothetical protein